MQQNRRAPLTQRLVFMLGLFIGGVAGILPAMAAEGEPRVHQGGEANLVLPRLDDKDLAAFGGLSGHNLLLGGIVITLLGLGFGLIMFKNMRNRPVHRSMLEMSELIYETCKTYLITQGKFLAILWFLIGAIMVAYFGGIMHMGLTRVATILAFSVLGIAGSYGVAWFGIRMNTYEIGRAHV